jgi:hypothetical protein
MAARATVAAVATMTAEQAAEESTVAARATMATVAAVAAPATGATVAAAATPATAGLSAVGVHRHGGEANHGQEQGDAQNENSIHPRNLQYGYSNGIPKP